MEKIRNHAREEKKKMETRKKNKGIVGKYITNRGIEAVLHDCGYNLRTARNHLRRECGLPKDVNISYNMKKFKEYLKSSLNNHFGKSIEIVKTFLLQNFGGSND